MRRKAARARVVRYIGQPQACPFAQEHSQQASSERDMTDPRSLFVADPARHELEDMPLLIEHANRGISRVHLPARDIYQLLEDAVQRELRSQGDPRLHQPADVLDAV